jgi:MFS family permease
VTLTAGFMSLLDVSIVAVALPSMREGLGASPAAIQWVVSGYALTFGLALVPAGRLGDAIGRRTMFLAALTGFVVCSAAAGAAQSIGMLVAARLVQGVALVLAARLLPRGTPGRRGHIDVAGVALLGGGVLALMLPLVQAESGGLARLWWLFLVGVVLLVCFALWERRVVRHGGDPLLDPRLVTALFYLVLASTGNDFRAAVAAALAAAVVGVAAALVVAVVEWRREVHRERREAGDGQPAEQHP